MWQNCVNFEDLVSSTFCRKSPFPNFRRLTIFGHFCPWFAGSTCRGGSSWAATTCGRSGTTSASPSATQSAAAATGPRWTWRSCTWTRRRTGGSRSPCWWNKSEIWSRILTLQKNLFFSLFRTLSGASPTGAWALSRFAPGARGRPWTTARYELTRVLLQQMKCQKHATGLQTLKCDFTRKVYFDGNEGRGPGVQKF